MNAPFPATALEPEAATPLILALPKGRILKDRRAVGLGLAAAAVAITRIPRDASQSPRLSRYICKHVALLARKDDVHNIATY